MTDDRAERVAAIRRISAGSGNKLRRSRAERRAGAFKESPELERLVELREKNPDRYDAVVSPSMRTTIGFYESAKRAHE